MFSDSINSSLHRSIYQQTDSDFSFCSYSVHPTNNGYDWFWFPSTLLNHFAEWKFSFVSMDCQLECQFQQPHQQHPWVRWSFFEEPWRMHNPIIRNAITGEWTPFLALKSNWSCTLGRMDGWMIYLYFIHHQECVLVYLQNLISLMNNIQWPLLASWCFL